MTARIYRPSPNAMQSGRGKSKTWILVHEPAVAREIEPLGDPGGTIERIAEEGGFDTIVIGSRAPGAIDQLVRGSIPEHVVTHTSATVVVTH